MQIVNYAINLNLFFLMTLMQTLFLEESVY